MQPSITPGIYQHYKGKRYFVLGLSRDTQTNETYVVYRHLYDSDWAHLVHRPYTMFCSDVIVDGQTQPRFQLVAT